jgi:hypothetical protein
MWPRIDSRRKWRVLYCTLSAWCLETSLAAAQADKPAASSTTEAKSGTPPDATSSGGTASEPSNATPSDTPAATDTQAAAAASTPVDSSAVEGEVIGKVPVAEPPPEEKKPIASANQPNMAGAVVAHKDELAEPGYLPGYRRYFGLGYSPYAPSIGSMPGGLTPGFGSSMPTKNWTFSFVGSANVTAQFSGMQRHYPTEGQSGFVLHSAPRVIEEYSSFTSSSTVPGNWVSLRFAYGTPKVTANLSLDTWNPVLPTSYYQMGSQSYVNNAYLAFVPEPLGKLRVRVNAGQMTTNYGMLSKYNSGVYVNPMGAVLRGIGEASIAEYDMDNSLTLSAEHGLMMSRDGTPSNNYITEVSNGYNRKYWAGAYINHAHLGLHAKGHYDVLVELHYINAFSHDERAQSPADNQQTPAIDESYIRDPRIRVLGADVKVTHDSWGMLGAGVSYIDAKHSYPLKPLMTYAGDGEWLTDRWFGVTTGGTGKIFVAALNYGGSIGQIISHPHPFSGNGPDLVINTGLHWTKTWTDYQDFDKRVRWKCAFDALYTFIRYVGVGARIDHIVPNSKDSGEDYNVLATRLQFKTDWTSRETLSLIYGRWFYGPRTRNEGTGLRTPDRLDNHLFALNFNLWW